MNRSWYVATLYSLNVTHPTIIQSIKKFQGQLSCVVWDKGNDGHIIQNTNVAKQKDKPKWKCQQAYEGNQNTLFIFTLLIQYIYN